MGISPIYSLDESDCECCQYKPCQSLWETRVGMNQGAAWQGTFAMLETLCDWNGYGEVILHGWSRGGVGIKVFFFLDVGDG